MQILIDDRELRSALAEALRRLGRAPLVQRLDVGDIRIGDRLLIERKTALDFAQSLRDRRLDNQLARLTAEQRRAPLQILFILEGALDDPPLRGFDVHQLREAILSIQLDWHLPLVRTADVNDTAHWIDALARRIESHKPALGGRFQPTPAERSGPPPVAARRASTAARDPQSAQQAALTGVPGLGPARARALLERFGSIHGVKAAGETGWRAVPGVGPQLVRALATFFERSPLPPPPR
jgi:ERCC4-type nuclease